MMSRRFGSWVLGLLLSACTPSTHYPAQGTFAPEFDARTQTGERVQLHALRGHPIVLYFYPADETPGCTKEACAFRDNWQRFQREGALVFGVSRDPVESHQQFAQKHQLPFPLLLDQAGTIADAYGVPAVLNMDKRVTFLIDRDGRVARVFPDVDPATHVEQVLSAIAALESQAPATTASAAP